MITTFENFVEFERDVLKALNKPGAYEYLEKARKGMKESLKTIGAEGNIADILQTERIIAQSDLEHFGKSKPMRNSLAKTLKQIGYAENMLGIIADPDEYRTVSKSYNDSRNLKRGVPYDEARQFFSSHGARLLNLDKTRLDDSTRAILNVRKSNMFKADDAYEMMQRKVLGLDQSQGQGMGM